MNYQISLKNLAEHTEQEVFDQVARHLLEQGCRSIEDGLCAYRTRWGHKCAAGCLIADDEYNPEYNYMAWMSMVARGLAPDVHLDLIQRLQNIHDERPHGRWYAELQDLADDLGLNMPTMM